MINSITPLVISTVSACRAYVETVLIALSVTSTWRITPFSSHASDEFVLALILFFTMLSYFFCYLRYKYLSNKSLV